MKIYHIGFLKRGRTLVIQARENVDLLSCEIWRYCGRRETTKQAMRERLAQDRAAVLAEIRRDGFPECQRIVID